MASEMLRDFHYNSEVTSNILDSKTGTQQCRFERWSLIAGAPFLCSNFSHVTCTKKSLFGEYGGCSTASHAAGNAPTGHDACT